jgi:hypothetical protein
MRDRDGVLLWYDAYTGFADHPDALALGEPAELDPATVSDIEDQLLTAWDAVRGGFDTTDDGACVMPGANLLILPVPSPAPGPPHRAAGRAGGQDRPRVQ